MSQLRQGLDNFAVKIAQFTTTHPWKVVAACLIFCIGVASGIPNLSFSNNYRAFFSDENPELLAFESFQATYSKADNFLFVVVPENGDVFDPNVLKLVQEITEAGWQLPYANRVDSISNYQHTYALDDDLIVEDFIGDLETLTPSDLENKRALALAEPLLRNQLITSNADATAVQVVLNYPEKSLTEVPESVAEARALKAQLQEAYPNIEIILTGTSMLNNAFSEAAIADFNTLVPLMILLIMIMTVVGVRSISAMLVTQLLVILSMLAAMGWAGFMRVELAGPSPSATIVILTLAIADSIHILVSARTAMLKGMEKQAAIIESMRLNFLPVSITSITTIVGFLALNFSDAPPFRDFGNISAVGIGFAWFLSMTLLPALLCKVPFKAKPRQEAQSQWLDHFADWVIAHWKKLLILCGGSSLILIGLIPRLELSDQFREYFDERIPFRAQSDLAIEHFGFYPMEIPVKAGDPGGINQPEFLKALNAFSDWLREQPSVTHVYSYADIVKRLNKNMHGDDPSYYRIPDDPELAAQYLLLYELSLPYGLNLTDRIDIDKSATRVTATLDGRVSSIEVRELLDNIQAWFSEHAPQYSAGPTGPQIMFTFIAQRNVESMVTGTVIAVLAIAVIMMFALQSASMGLLSLIPNGLPILAAFGVWSLLIGEVGFSVAAVASLSLGIVIDDTVHLLTKYIRGKQEQGLSTADAIRYAFNTVGLAIVVNTFVLLAGFFVMTFSAFQINQQMGLLTCLSIGLALILDFLLLPAVLLALARISGEDKNNLPDNETTNASANKTTEGERHGAIPKAP